MTEDNKYIAGSSGGKGGGGDYPTIAEDNLHSKQFATLLDLISEGEIEGFASASKEARVKGTEAYRNAAKKDIFLDDTPILSSNADSNNPQAVDFNHQDVDLDIRFGTDPQAKMSRVSDQSGSQGSASLFGVGVKVEDGAPVTRQLTNNSSLDAVKITVTVPLLQIIQDDGDIVGSGLTFDIQIQYNGGGFTTVHQATIKGRTADAYNKEYRIELTGSHPVDLRLVKTTGNSTDRNMRDLIWQSYTELIDDANTYPNSAYTRLRLDSELFNRIPTRKFRIRGVKVRIPGAGASGSGTPTVDIETGRIIYPSGYIFNGVMGAAQWTTCPAMILLDLLTNARYGLGNHIIDSNLDLFSFVTASKFSNELVSDSFGGQEARFACNINIQTSIEAFTVINTLSSVMRCMPIWSEGALLLTQDSPKDPSYLFTLANVGPEGFSYSGSSLKTRSTVIAVSYLNMDTRDLDYEEVHAESAYKSKYGLHVKRVKALGCTSRGQARRFAKAILFAEQRETEVVSFSTSMESGCVVRPGAIISISDPARSGIRRAGRISAATTTEITVDDSSATDLSDQNNPKLSVILPNGTLETKNVVSISGKVITVSYLDPFSVAPNPNSVWMLENDTVSAQSFKVMSVEERDGINYGITALAYVNEKYAFIEDGETIPQQNITTLNLLKPPPQGLTADEVIVLINNQPVSKLIIRWQPVTGVSNYIVNYRYNDNNIISTTTASPDFEIFNTKVGAYEVSVRSLSASLEPSATATTGTFNTLGKTAVPGDVTGVSAEQIPGDNGSIRLSWNKSVDLDVTHGGFVYIRHDSSRTDGTGTFENAVDLIEAVPGNSTSAIVPAITGEYILKFQDDGGRFSTGEGSVVVQLADTSNNLLIQTRREDQDVPKFQGVKVNTAVDEATDALNLAGVGLFDDIGVTIGTSFDDPVVASIDDIGGSAPSGSYDFKDTLDLGGVFSLDLVRHFKTEGFYPSELFDAIRDVDKRNPFDGTEANDVDAQLFVRRTQDDPSSSSPTYTAFEPFSSGRFTARGCQFRTVLTSTDPDQDIRVFELGYTAKIQARQEIRTNITQSAGPTAYTFDNTFFTGTTALLGANSNLPSVNITAQNLASGDYFVITNLSGTGFTIDFKNSSNASIGKNFSYTAVGFGKG